MFRSTLPANEMLGTLLNCAAIVLGALVGAAARGEIQPRRQILLRVLVGVLAVWFGFSIALQALTSGTWQYGVRLFLILLVAMIAGRFIGRLCHIQAGLNRAGQYAKDRLASKEPNDGLLAAAILFCAAPLGIVGAIEDGVNNQFRPLLVKALIDGLGAFSFGRMFGWRLAIAAVPVAGLQVAVAYAAQSAAPWLERHNVLDPVHVVAGFLLIYVSLIVFEVKKVELGDYLPALVVAPAISLLFR